MSTESKRHKAALLESKEEDDESEENREEIDVFAYPELFKEVRRQAVNKLGLSSDKALMACSELCRALTCKGEHEDPMSLSLPPLLDQLWHVALLNTEEYACFCDESFGHFIHHTTMTDADLVRDKNARVDSTVKMYRSLFETEPIAEFWEREREPENHKLAIQQQIIPQETKIRITLVDHGDRTGNPQGDRVYFTVSKSMRIERIISGYANLKGVALGSFRLFYDGKPLREPQSTVGDYDMEDDDLIEVAFEQCGC